MLKIHFLMAGAISWVALSLAAHSVSAAELHLRTVQAWEEYVRVTEKRVAGELADGHRFLATDFLSDDESRSARSLVRSGQIYIRKMHSAGGGELRVNGGMIHHWLGSVFVPGVKLGSLMRWIQDYDHHDRYFAEVERSKLVSLDGSTYKIFLRLRRKKIVTVVYNTDHTVVYRYHDAARISSRGSATRIAEIDDPGTPAEKENQVGNDRGFLWRLNSYWRFQEEPGGVIVECESVSLSRSIPPGLGWLIRGYVESVPRESLENTLISIREGSQKTVGLEIQNRRE